MGKSRKYTDDDFIKAVKESQSIRQVLLHLNLKEAGGNYALCNKRIADLKIDISHFGTIKERQGWAKGKKIQGRYVYSLEELLVEGSSFQSFKLKNRLLAAGLFDPVCSICKLEKWLEKSIPLELDHINGDSKDNRIENLRLLCPNCHSTTPTYRGKNKNKN